MHPLAYQQNVLHFKPPQPLWLHGIPTKIFKIAPFLRVREQHMKVVFTEKKTPPSRILYQQVQCAVRRERFVLFFMTIL